MMTIDNKCTTILLEELTLALKLLNCWQTQIPSALALSSSSPFCCDTLSFEQWLQFVFIPKITQMINLGQALPNKIALTPMAEESFKHLSVQAKPLLVIINKIDKTLTGQEHNQ
jgi:uncharacterized protein YqcC (DUF446 family)